MKKSSDLFAAAILSIFLVASSFGQPSTVSKSASKFAKKNSVTTKANEVVTIERIEKDFSEALTLIQDNHYSGKRLEYNDLFKASIVSMLHTLDPHSSYFDSKEFEEFRSNQNSRYYGIGATINDLRDPSGKVIATFIKATFKGAPANRAGLRYGDKIVEVNGKPMLGKPYPVVRDELRGPRGTVAKLVVERYGTGKRENIEIIRDAVSTPSISDAYMFRPGIGYISMTGGFNRTTYDEFRRAMRKLKARGMQHVILDLRENGGGLVNQAYYVANTFLESGQTIFTQKGRQRRSARSFAADNPNPDNTPIVVMVNGSTASASEIVAGALQDHDRALIVGENTFGKGLVQNPYMLKYGSMLLLTIAKYETPSGRLIQRDYSDGNLYNYYTNGGTLDEKNKPKKRKGAEKLTDSGRVVYSGGGIAPDIYAKMPTISNQRYRIREKLSDPIFSFALNVAFRKVKGLERLTVDRAIVFDYDLKNNDFAIDESVYKAFKEYVIKNYKISAAKIDREKEFVKRSLRGELVTAAYGSQTAFRVHREYDSQLKRATVAMPEARRLFMQRQKSAKNRRNEQD
ncbi:MAG: PDZ domain-containing protein [Pyrinomonadaceae bacterium]|nr:PDZ domain-containing protein [Pyrinomonadaceae bacterium]